MVTKNGTRAKESNVTTPAQMPPRLYRALEEAEALIAAGRGTRALVQDGHVYLEGGICAGCGTEPHRLPILVEANNAGNPWCPGCGGRALVALEVNETTFDNGLCRLTGSQVYHLVAPPYGETPLCMPNAKAGRMQSVPGDDAEVTCKRCMAKRDGDLGAYERTIPVRGVKA